VHGFNVSFRDAVDTTARLSVQLRNHVRLVLFSWPSAGSTWKYGDDGDMAAVSSGALAGLLEMLAGLAPRRKVHLVAHSMGNRIMLEGLDTIHKKGRDPGWTAYEELMSIAPDVECGSYGRIAADLQGVPPSQRLFKRATLYLYEDDYALKWSRRYWTVKDRAQVCRMGSRRGRDAAAVAGLEAVDWACINEIVDTHSYYIQNDYIARDLRSIVAEHKTPRDRDLEPVDVAPAGRYFLHLSAVNRKCAGFP
jgi:esterase/lipase superfamily enzyme